MSIPATTNLPLPLPPSQSSTSLRRLSLPLPPSTSSASLASAASGSLGGPTPLASGDRHNGQGQGLARAQSTSRASRTPLSMQLFQERHATEFAHLYVNSGVAGVKAGNEGSQEEHWEAERRRARERRESWLKLVGAGSVLAGTTGPDQSARGKENDNGEGKPPTARQGRRPLSLLSKRQLDVGGRGLGGNEELGLKKLPEEGRLPSRKLSTISAPITAPQPPPRSQLRAHPHPAPITLTPLAPCTLSEHHKTPDLSSPLRSDAYPPPSPETDPNIATPQPNQLGLALTLPYPCPPARKDTPSDELQGGSAGDEGGGEDAGVEDHGEGDTSLQRSTYSWASSFSGETSELRTAAHYVPSSMSVSLSQPSLSYLTAHPQEAQDELLNTPEKTKIRRKRIVALAHTVRQLEGVGSRDVEDPNFYSALVKAWKERPGMVVQEPVWTPDCERMEGEAEEVLQIYANPPSAHTRRHTPHTLHPHPLTSTPKNHHSSSNPATSVSSSLSQPLSHPSYVSSNAFRYSYASTLHDLAADGGAERGEQLLAQKGWLRTPLFRERDWDGGHNPSAPFSQGEFRIRPVGETQPGGSVGRRASVGSVSSDPSRYSRTSRYSTASFGNSREGPSQAYTPVPALPERPLRRARTDISRLQQDGSLAPLRADAVEATAAGEGSDARWGLGFLRGGMGPGHPPNGERTELRPSSVFPSGTLDEEVGWLREEMGGSASGGGSMEVGMSDEMARLEKEAGIGEDEGEGDLGQGFWRGEDGKSGLVGMIKRRGSTPASDAGDAGLTAVKREVHEKAQGKEWQDVGEESESEMITVDLSHSESSHPRPYAPSHIHLHTLPPALVLAPGPASASNPVHGYAGGPLSSSPSRPQSYLTRSIIYSTRHIEEATAAAATAAEKEEGGAGAWAGREWGRVLAGEEGEGEGSYPSLESGSFPSRRLSWSRPPTPPQPAHVQTAQAGPRSKGQTSPLQLFPASTHPPVSAQVRFDAPTQQGTMQTPALMHKSSRRRLSPPPSRTHTRTFSEAQAEEEESGIGELQTVFPVTSKTLLERRAEEREKGVQNGMGAGLGMGLPPIMRMTSSRELGSGGRLGSGTGAWFAGAPPAAPAASARAPRAPSTAGAGLRGPEGLPRGYPLPPPPAVLGATNQHQSFDRCYSPGIPVGGTVGGRVESLGGQERSGVAGERVEEGVSGVSGVSAGVEGLEDVWGPGSEEGGWVVVGDTQSRWKRNNEGASGAYSERDQRGGDVLVHSGYVHPAPATATATRTAPDDAFAHDTEKNLPPPPPAPRLPLVLFILGFFLPFLWLFGGWLCSPPVPAMTHAPSSTDKRWMYHPDRRVRWCRWAAVVGLPVYITGVGVVVGVVCGVLL